MLDREPTQGSFWDSQWIEHLIDKESFEWHFRETIRPMMSDQDFEWAYDLDRGRKAIPPSLIASALILQRKYNLSDRDMEKQIRYNLATKYALGLPMDDKGFDHTTLCKFRLMMVKNHTARLYFERFREALVQAGLIQAGEVAVIDTTHVIADIAIPNTIELVTMGIKGVLEALEKVSWSRKDQVVKDLNLASLSQRDVTQKTKDHLTGLVHAAKSLVSYLEETGDQSLPGVEEKVAQLKRILQENVTERPIDRGGKGHGKGGVVVEERRDPVRDRLVSPVDPEARHGHKSKTKSFIGYKAQVLESEKEFILSIEGLPGNRHDNHRVSEMVSELVQRGIRPGTLLGDKAYGDEPLALRLQHMGVWIRTPLKEERSGPYFSCDDFEYDVSGESGLPFLRCPGGYETSLSRKTYGGRVFFFTGCAGCPLKKKCTPAGDRTVQITSGYFFRRHKREFLQTLSYKEMMKDRAKIERKNSQLKNRLGLKRCRWRGLAKFKFQCLMTALVANIQRWVTLLLHAPPWRPAPVMISFR